MDGTRCQAVTDGGGLPLGGQDGHGQLLHVKETRVLGRANFNLAASGKVEARRELPRPRGAVERVGFRTDGGRAAGLGTGRPRHVSDAKRSPSPGGQDAERRAGAGGGARLGGGLGGGGRGRGTAGGAMRWMR